MFSDRHSSSSPSSRIFESHTVLTLLASLSCFFSLLVEYLSVSLLLPSASSQLTVQSLQRRRTLPHHHPSRSRARQTPFSRQPLPATDGCERPFHVSRLEARHFACVSSLAPGNRPLTRLAHPQNTSRPSRFSQRPPSYSRRRAPTTMAPCARIRATPTSASCTTSRSRSACTASPCSGSRRTTI